MTIREALKLAEEILLDAGVPDARLDAEYLLAGVLDAPRLLVVASGETPLTDARAEQYFTLVARRQGREPLQYILGTQPFMGCSFYVDKRVLIPRQDTETLCEQALLNAPETGVYGLRVGYHTEAGKGVDMEYSLLVDGQPYSAANAVVSLNRVWVDEGQPERTATGNDLRPKQIEAFLWTEALLADTNEVEGQVRLALEAGEHEIALTALRETAVIDYMALEAAPALPAYTEYLAAHSGMREVSGVELVLQAENPAYEPIVLIGEEMGRAVIEGLAVGFMRNI